MKPTCLFAVAALTAALASCSNSRNAGGDYDTSNPYGVPDYGDTASNVSSEAPSNPIYDTPAAYEEAGEYTPAPDNSVVDPGMSAPRSTAVDRSSSSPATTHLVVKGDTLGGIARKYGVSISAIKRANNMTNDIVVLGKTLKIPAR